MTLAKDATSLDPAYWGPVFWEVMYIASAGFSATPSENEKIGFKMFFDSLRYVLPCSKCRADYDAYLLANPLSDTDLQCRDSLFLWVFNLHVSTSQRLNKANLPTLEAARLNFLPPPLLTANTPALPNPHTLFPKGPPTFHNPTHKNIATRNPLLQPFAAVPIPFLQKITAGSAPSKHSIGAALALSAATSAIAAVAPFSRSLSRPITTSLSRSITAPLSRPLTAPVAAPLSRPVAAPLSRPVATSLQRAGTFSASVNRPAFLFPARQEKGINVAPIKALASRQGNLLHGLVGSGTARNDGADHSVKTNFLQQLADKKKQLRETPPVVRPLAFDRSKYIVGGCGCGGRKTVPFSKPQRV